MEAPSRLEKGLRTELGLILTRRNLKIMIACEVNGRSPGAVPACPKYLSCAWCDRL
jgi:hypothetical protein